MEFSADALLGPFALLVAALVAVGVLWREDRRVYRERIDDLKQQRDIAVSGWTTQTEANRVLAEDVLKRRPSERVK